MEKKLKIRRRITTQEEYETCPELKEVWSGFQGMSSSIDVMRRPEFTFIEGIVVDVDPKDNYGQAFKLFRRYKVKGRGSIFVREEVIGSTLSRMPSELLEITDTEVIQTGLYLPQGELGLPDKNYLLPR